jgi:hypothetical protein
LLPWCLHRARTLARLGHGLEEHVFHLLDVRERRLERLLGQGHAVADELLERPPVGLDRLQKGSVDARQGLAEERLSIRGAGRVLRHAERGRAGHRLHHLADVGERHLPPLQGPQGRRAHGLTEALALLGARFGEHRDHRVLVDA